MRWLNVLFMTWCAMLCMLKAKVCLFKERGEGWNQVHRRLWVSNFGFEYDLKEFFMRKKFTREFPSEASTERLRKGFMRYLGQKVMLECYVGIKNYSNCARASRWFFKVLRLAWFPPIQFQIGYQDFRFFDQWNEYSRDSLI